MRGSGSPPRDGKKGGCTPHQPLFSWLSRANSQMLGMAASVIYFCPPEALCRQWWHLHPRAPAGGQAPERHLTPPQTRPCPSFNFSPCPEDLDPRAGSWLGSHTAWAGGHPVPAMGAGRRSCILSSFALLYGWLVGISLPACGIILNGPYLS